MPGASDKVIIEFKDKDGRKVKMEFGGEFTGQELKQLFDFVRNGLSWNSESEPCPDSKDTKFQRFQDILSRQFTNVQFTSLDALLVAQEDLGLQLKRALVSTYLMRLVDKGILERRWSSSGWVYRLVSKAIVER
ncbi:MAG: hypothetical protein ACUVQ8_05355 [Nitrososphaeria archaeon]